MHYMKAWKLKNPRAYRSILMKHRYGITLEQYEQLLDKQNGVCAICEKAETIKGKSNLSIDHCHRTKKVRGLLCDSCNKGLGHFKDNTNLLDRAKSYLLE